MDEHRGAIDATPELAEKLRMDVEDFEHFFGACWELGQGPVAHDFDSDPSGGGGYDITPWHLQGEPAQLMVRVFEHGVFLARPRARFAGAAPAGYEPMDQVYLGVHELTEQADSAVRTMLTRRRRSFRWCSRCRRVNAPEGMFDDRCSTCSGIVN